MRKYITTLAVLLLMAIGCASKAESKGTVTDEGIAASNAWLAIVDAGRYGESWERACSYFRNAVAKEQWERQAAAVRGPLGPVLSRKVASAKYMTKLPGAPDGEYVVIQYRTKFQNKAEAVETVTPMRDEDGVFRVSGYYVR